MKKIVLILGIAALSIAAVWACTSGQNDFGEKAVIGDEAPASNSPILPSLAMTDGKGSAVNLQSLKGKKVFVNLWASWCPPCRAEMPSIEKLYASVNKDKVAFVMLSYDENPVASLRFLKQQNLTLPVYFPAEQPPAIFQPDGIPATYIFDESGKLVKQNFGADNYDTEAYRQLLR